MKTIYIVLISLLGTAALATGGFFAVRYIIDNHDRPEPITYIPEENLGDIRSVKYRTPDLQMEHAQGKVYSILVEGNDNIFPVTKYYDRDGWLLVGQTYPDCEDLTHKRNSSNQLIKLSWSIGEFDGARIEYEWKYNKKGFISKTVGAGYEHGWSGEYSYDKDDNLIKIKEFHTGEGDAYTEEFTYSNYKFDKHGNWISRSVKHVFIIYNDYEYNDIYDTETNYFTETREITYY